MRVHLHELYYYFFFALVIDSRVVMKMARSRSSSSTKNNRFSYGDHIKVLWQVLASLIDVFFYKTIPLLAHIHHPYEPVLALPTVCYGGDALHLHRRRSCQEPKFLSTLPFDIDIYSIYKITKISHWSSQHLTQI